MGETAQLFTTLTRVLASPPDKAHQAIGILLRQALHATGPDRAFLLLRSDGGALIPHHDSALPGLPPRQMPLQPLPTQRLAPWRAQFERGEGLRLPMDPDPTADPALADLACHPGLAQALLLPLCAQGEVLGLAVFSCAPPAAEPALATIAAILAALLLSHEARAPDPIAAQSRLADFAATSPDWFWETDAEDRFTYLSESFQPRTGRSIGRALGTTRWQVRDRYSEARASADWDGLEACIKARQAFRDFVYKLPALEPGDRDVWVRTSGQPWFDPDGSYRGYRGVSSDITALKTAETRLQDIIEASGAASFEVDLETGRTTINDRWAAMLGLTRDELDLSDTPAWLSHMHPDDRAHAQAALDRCLAGETPRYLAEFRLRHRRGHWVSVVSHGRVTRRDPSGKALCLIGANIDITALKDAQSRIEQIIRGASVGTWEWDGHTGRNQVNEIWAAMLGYEHADFAQLTLDQWRDLVHPEDLPDLLRHFEEQFKVQDTFESVFRMRHREGHWVWVLSRGQVSERAPDGTVIRVSGIHLDVTEAKAREAELMVTGDRLRRALSERDMAERQLRDFAMHDDLTGALNRRSFHVELKERLDACAKGGSEVCIAMIDLIRFKSINETHGHGAGDKLLREVIRRWRFTEERGAQVFRIGGDEFAVMMPGANLADRMSALIQDMRAALAAPFRLNAQSVRMEMSVGLAMAPRDGLTLDELAANADLALFASKAENGHSRRYTPELRQTARQRHEVVQDLLASRVERDFYLLYQPIIELSSNRIAGVEALLRWNHPRRGVLSPAEFIDDLCSLDHSATVGNWILRTACQQVADWNREFGSDLLLSVNVFPLQARNPDFPALVAQALAASGLSSAALEIEVTENIALREGSVARQVLQGLSDMGIAFSLDDFGTGFSSLQSLLHLAPRTLKVDRSFVDGPHPCARRVAILRSIHHLAQGLGLRTIVEGVETQATAREMQAIGFDFGQGYLWGKPFQAADLGPILRRQASPAAPRDA